MDRSQKLINPLVSETTMSACVLYLCMYYITAVIHIIMIMAIQPMEIDMTLNQESGALIWKGTK